MAPERKSELVADLDHWRHLQSWAKALIDEVAAAVGGQAEGSRGIEQYQWTVHVKGANDLLSLTLFLRQEHPHKWSVHTIDSADAKEVRDGDHFDENWVHGSVNQLLAHHNRKPLA